ncbi:MAG TPA: hypothetical protein RMG48_05380 [Myxococcales bacterium LLY-WYZ-16_1]|nr:hypothetical protein [Myxococcales bacterium LLY-WYZ-16_1]
MSGPMMLQPPERPFDFDVLDAPGGFAWWYVDAFDASGNGLVVIWSWGLPFLPGYLDARRQGRPEPPRARPSLNVVTYRDGEPDFYLLQEYDADRAHWTRRASREVWNFESSRFECVRSGGRVHLLGKLDCEVPGMSGRLTGDLRLEGPAVHLARTDELPDSPHGWIPISTPSDLEAELSVGDETLLRLRGVAYFDRNASTRALDDLGIEHWIWGRSAAADRTAIVFGLFPPEGQPPLAFCAQLTPDGAMTLTRTGPPRLDGPRTGRFGMPYWSALELTGRDGTAVRVAQDRIIEDGPFYLRTLGQLGLDGGPARESVTEWIRPDRVDRDWQRPLVRMRVHRARARNSMWLPLFSGPRTGRWGRLLQSWRGRP